MNDPELPGAAADEPATSIPDDKDTSGELRGRATILSGYEVRLRVLDYELGMVCGDPPRAEQLFTRHYVQFNCMCDGKKDSSQILMDGQVFRGGVVCTVKCDDGHNDREDRNGMTNGLVYAADLSSEEVSMTVSLRPQPFHELLDRAGTINAIRLTLNGGVVREPENRVLWCGGCSLFVFGADFITIPHRQAA